MCARCLFGSIRVPRGDGGDAALVFGNDLLGATRVSQSACGEAPHTLGQLPRNAGQPGVARDVVDGIVERCVGGHGARQVVALELRAQLVDELAESLDPRGIGALRRKARRKAVMHLMQLADLDGFLEVDAAHNRASIEVVRHQVVVDEAPEGLAYRCATHSELLGELGLNEPRSGL